jgi:hypothetical protein
LPNFLQNTCQDLHQAVNLYNNVESESRPEITIPFQQGKIELFGVSSLDHLSGLCKGLLYHIAICALQKIDSISLLTRNSWRSFSRWRVALDMVGRLRACGRRLYRNFALQLPRRSSAKTLANDDALRGCSCKTHTDTSIEGGR